MKWLDCHRDLFMDLVRIYLGIGLFVMGGHYVMNVGPLLGMMQDRGVPFGSMALAHYVALAHLGGGILLTVGMCTRWAALAQVPILFGAVFFVNAPHGLFSPGLTLEFSALVLFLLVLFSFFGAGRFSVDHYLFRDGVEPVQAI